MKLIEDHSDFSFEIGTNPRGGGYIEVSPETPEEEKLLRRAGYLPHGPYAEDPQMYFRVPCRKVRHAPNPHDDGINPVFVDMVHRYGWTVKGYPEL